jgi:RimJ/RimL family protein N-acetyltransferase
VIALSDRRAPQLDTERLVLRGLDLADATSVAERAGDRRVARFLIAVPSPYPASLAARWIMARIAWWPQSRGLTLAITERANPAVLLGTVSLKRVVRDQRAELGYWLGVDAWGKGYATEATNAMIDFGFGELGLSRIYAQVLEGNEASCRVLEKVGMLSEGIRRRHVRKGKKLCDVSLWGLLRDEWDERQP